MSKAIIQKLISSGEPFRITIWDGLLSEFDLDLISDLCISQLKCDLDPSRTRYQRAQFENVVSLCMQDKGVYSLSYCTFEVEKGYQNGEDFLKFGFGDSSRRLDRRINQKHSIPYSTIRNNLAPVIRLNSRKITRPNGGYSQVLATSLSPGTYLERRLGKTDLNLTRIATEQGQTCLEFLVRTKIILVIDKTRDELEELMRIPMKDGAYFADIFPTACRGAADNCEDVLINSVSHQSGHRIPEVLIFSRFSDAIDFVERNQDCQFLLLSDRYSQVYSPSTWQRIAANDNYRLLHIAKWSDFKKLYYSNLVRDDHETVKKMVVTGELVSRQELRSTVSEVADPSIHELITEIAANRDAIKDTNPDLATVHSKYISTVCRSLSLDQSDIESLRRLDLVTGLSLATKAIELTNGHNPKRAKIAQLAATGELILLTDRVEKANNAQILGVTVRDVADCDKPVPTGVRYVIHYIDKWFLMNAIFPLLMLQKINLNQLLFVLYPTEVRALYGIYRQFGRTVLPYIRNRKLLGAEYAEKEDDPDNYSESFSNFHEVTVDFSRLSRHYFSDRRGRESNLHVKVTTLGLRGEGRDYLAFLTNNYKPYLLEGDDLRRVALESIAVGDTVVFFEGAGERGILEAYEDIFFDGDKEHIANSKKWKQYLSKYLKCENGKCNNFRVKSLLQHLRERNLYRSEIDVYRWLDNDSIGTLNPREDFPKIAYAIGSPEFLAECQALAESCIHLQIKCKQVGRYLKQLALRDFSGAGLESELGSLRNQASDRIDQIVRKIKCLRVQYVDRSEQFVSRIVANVLHETADD